MFIDNTGKLTPTLKIVIRSLVNGHTYVQKYTCMQKLMNTIH